MLGSITYSSGPEDYAYAQSYDESYSPPLYDVGYVAISSDTGEEDVVIKAAMSEDFVAGECEVLVCTTLLRHGGTLIRLACSPPGMINGFKMRDITRLHLCVITTSS